MAIAVDAMGGDLAPRANVEGAVAAAREWGLETVLVGREDEIRLELERAGWRGGSAIKTVDAAETIAMDDPSTAPLKKKRASSIRVAAQLVREGKADGLFSAGHTGAAMVAAKVVIGLVDGIDRPALAAVLPGIPRKRLLLDVGANVACRPEHYRDFAIMGHFYAQEVLGIAKPRIGLMSVGEEEGKGTDVIREVFSLLKRSGLNFTGNCEGRDVFTGSVDVIVTDGFTGNVILKTSESLATLVEQALRAEVVRSLQASLGFLLARDAFRAFKKRLDYAEYGGAPLLGLRGACLIGHGRSTSRAVKNGIRAAHEFVARRVAEKIQAKTRDLGLAAAAAL